MTQAIVVPAFGGPEVLRWQDVPTPQPGPGQLRLNTALTGVNFADIQARRGGYKGGQTPPFIPGLDALGTVDAIGEGVTGFQLGQRVAAFSLGGSYATQVLATAELTYALPETLPDEAGASATVLITAYNTLTLAGRLQPGETVLIHAAAGGVGSSAVQLARLLGAGRVIGTAGSDQKCEVVRSLGADEAINHRTQDFARRVRELTDGRGADLILDSVGGETTERGLTCLADFGRLVAFGGASGQAASIKTPELHRTNRAVIGYSSGHYRQHRPAALRPAADAVFGLFARGELKVLVDRFYPLSEAAQAQQLVESRQSVGRVLLRP